jgi:protease-4
MATDERVIGAVRRARSDRRIAGVVLHVDSPGGSALASDRIHHELEQLAAEKPLVACMANVAASGGYYVAAPAHAIVAQPTTITGSIGVVSARVLVAPLLERFGVTTETVKRGGRADLHEPTRRLTDEERAVIQAELEGAYQAFLAIVARGRKRPVADVHAVAQGRVWAGVDAARIGLLDELGGFEAALARVRSLVGGPRAAELEPVIVRAPREAGLPLDPPARKAAELARTATDLARRLGIDLGSLALASDPVLAWSEIAQRAGDL